MILFLGALLSGCAGFPLLTGPTNVAPSDPWSPELLAADAMDIGVLHATLNGKTTEKRADLESLAGKLEAFSQGTDLTEAALLAVGGDGAVGIAVARIVLRRTGLQPGKISAPEQVRAIATGLAKGIRTGIGK